MTHTEVKPRLEMRWVPVTDARGRTHMEMRWTEVGAQAVIHAAA